MDKLKQATEYIKSDNKTKAKQLLAELIQSEPNNELAWLWMSGVVDDTSQQRYCLDKVLKINPNNQHALAGLSKLENQPYSGGKQDAVANNSREPDVKPVNEMNSRYKSQPLPDISTWSNRFTGWGIWPDAAETGGNDTSSPPRELNMGLLVAEAHVAVKRMLGWAAFFLVIAIVLGALAVFVFGISSSPVLVVAALIFLGAALYRAANWYLNQNLTVRVFREGFTLTKDDKTQVVFWRDVDAVREQWSKVVYQGIIHVNTHKIEIQKSNGQKAEMDRTLDKIEEIGCFIQAAVADQLLPGRIDHLKNGGTCEFGVFKIDRQGITHKGKNFLPWNEVNSLEVHSVGQTTLRIHKISDSKWTTAWATENGGAVLNLNLFLELANWFINVSRLATNGDMDVLSTSVEGSFDGTEDYRMFITKREAQNGSQKTLYIGPSRQEKRLVVKIPAGTKSGTVYRFSDYGRPNPNGGTAGVLNVEVIAGKGARLQTSLEEFQMAAGIIIFILGMMWLSFWSTLDLITSAILAAMIGGLGGTLISIRRRWAGLISGAIGGVISFSLQTLYYILMYIFFGRESFWNYEMVIVLLISVIPAIGLYALITKKRDKEQT